ncbi:hypothetical protein AAMO2058_001185400 [Amorphochlora amoebiformis]
MYQSALFTLTARHNSDYSDIQYSPMGSPSLSRGHMATSSRLTRLTSRFASHPNPMQPTLPFIKQTMTINTPLNQNRNFNRNRNRNRNTPRHRCVSLPLCCPVQSLWCPCIAYAVPVLSLWCPCLPNAVPACVVLGCSCYPVVSWLSWGVPVVSCGILWCPVVSCGVLWYPMLPVVSVVPCDVLWCPVVSCGFNWCFSSALDLSTRIVGEISKSLMSPSLQCLHVSYCLTLVSSPPPFQVLCPAVRKEAEQQQQQLKPNQRGHPKQKLQQTQQSD